MLTYTYRYNRVIKWFKDHPVSKETCQCENHHIIPRSCGGLDIKENLVLLPLRWHYIVHCWLPAVYLEQGKQKEYEKMLFAWNRFQNCSKGFREGLQTIKEDSLLYQKLRQEYISLVSSTIGQKIEGKRNGRYNTHWWMNPETGESRSFKEIDIIPKNWIKGRKISNDAKKVIYNDKTNKKRLIPINKSIPIGWHTFQHKSYEYDNKTKKKVFRCRFCGAVKEKDQSNKTISTCKNKTLCWHFQPTKKLAKYFGFDKSSIGTERYYEEYHNAAKLFFVMWNSYKLSELRKKIKWENKSDAGLYSLYAALSKLFPEYKLLTID